MAQISNKDRTVFSEADKTVLNNFTSEELQQIGMLADQLDLILTEAKKRQREEVADSPARPRSAKRAIEV